MSQAVSAIQSRTQNDELAILKGAIEKFSTFKSVNDRSPMWGQKQIEPLLATRKSESIVVSQS